MQFLRDLRYFVLNLCQKIFFKIPIIIVNLIFNIFIKDEISNSFKIIEKKSSSKKSCIWLSYSGAIGDFTILLRLLIKLSDESDEKYDVITDIRFKKIIEKLNLCNFNVIYISKWLSNNTFKVSEKDLEVYNEILEMNLEYDNIFYFSKDISVLFLMRLSAIKYNQVISIESNYLTLSNYKKNRSFTLDKSNILLSFYFRKHINKLNLFPKIIPGIENLHLCDIAYYIMKSSFPEKSLKSIKIEKLFYTKIIKNTVAIMSDSNPRGKFLKPKYLIDLLNKDYQNYNVIILGNGNNYFKKLNKYQHNFNIINKLNYSEYIFDLYENIACVDEILAYDTSILHIASLMNKKIKLICNLQNKIYKKEFMYWLSYAGFNDMKIITMSSKFFEYKKQ